MLNYKHHFQLHNPLAPIVFYVHINGIWPAANALFMRSVVPLIFLPPTHSLAPHPQPPNTPDSSVQVW